MFVKDILLNFDDSKLIKWRLLTNERKSLIKNNTCCSELIKFLI